MDATDALELIAFGSVAITTLTLVELAVDITFPQWRVLVVIGPRPDGLTVSEIADRLGAALSPTSRLVGRLRSRGLVVTEKDPGDRRITRVRLAERGAELRASVFSRRRARLAMLVDQLGPLDECDTAFLARIAHVYAQYR